MKTRTDPTFEYIQTPRKTTPPVHISSVLEARMRDFILTRRALMKVGW